MSMATMTEAKPDKVIAHGTDVFTDTALFEHQWRIARVFADSDLAPKQYQGKPGNCLIALSMANRLRCDPMMFMQNSYIVHGRPGIEAKLAIGLANQSGIFKGPIRYRIEGTGDLKSWTAFATVASTGDVIEMTVSMTMVKAEKWDSNPKWKTMPDVMGRYRSAMFLIRTHCPEVIMGLPSREELEDFEGVPGEPKLGARKAQPLRAVVDMSTQLDELEGETEADQSTTEPADYDAPFAALSGEEAITAELNRIIQVGNGDEPFEADVIDLLKAAADRRIKATRGEKSNGKKQQELVK
jgi:hypothetical protein